MARQLFPELVAERFVRICQYVGGRAVGANLNLEDDSFASGIGAGPWSMAKPVDITGQATIVRDEQSGYTTGDDVVIKGPMADLAIYENYHLEGLPPEFTQIFFGVVSGMPTCPAPMSMLFQHELGHVTVHPAGDMEKYKKQSKSMPLPQTGGFSSQTMNILSDLVLNHSVMHSANILGTTDPDIMLRMRQEALYGLAGLYMMPQCQNVQAHANLVEAGSIPDTRYQPTEPCTAESDPNNPPAIPCPYMVSGSVHDQGCYDNHFVDATDPNKAEHFMFASGNTPFWQAVIGHGRGSQFYPMLSQACRYGLPEQNRTVQFLAQPALKEKFQYHWKPSLDDKMIVYNCTQCGNIWYAHDTAYTDLTTGSFITSDGRNSDPTFLESLDYYRRGQLCPGRAPYDSKYRCDAGIDKISSWSLEPDSKHVVDETWTFDNRPSGKTGLHGMEPIWAIQVSNSSLSISPGLGLIQLASNPGSFNVTAGCRIDRSYFSQLCPQCGEPTSNYYGEGQHHNGQGYTTEALERLFHSNDIAAMKTLNQLLFLQQWAGIYSDMPNVIDDSDLRLLSSSGRPIPKGWPRAKAFLTLAGMDEARMNRGC